MVRLTAAITLLSHLIYKVDSAVSSLDAVATNDTDLVADVGSFPLTSTDAPAPIPLDTFMDINGLIEKGRTMSLESLEIFLKEHRALSGNDPGRTSEYTDMASVVMTGCPALTDARATVQQALDSKYHEILRCLARHPIFKDRVQERWYWAMISDTPAFNPNAWTTELRGLVFKTDSIEFYEMMRFAVSLDQLSKEDLCEYIIVFDAINILNSLYPDMLNDIATNFSLMMEYTPPRIISKIINSARHPNLDTSRIAPQNVTSSIMLQYLFSVGYNQIPKICLRAMNSQLQIPFDCVQWYIKHGCLSLLQEIFQEIPKRSNGHNYFCNRAIKKGSLDVLKWLHTKEKIQCPSQHVVRCAVASGYFKTVEWIFAEFGNQIDWNAVITPCLLASQSYKVIEYLWNNSCITLSPEDIFYLLAAHGKFAELKAATDNSAISSHILNAAAMNGHIEILKWAYEKANILPDRVSVEDACEKGDYSALHWIWKVDSTKIARRSEHSEINATKCLLYAAMHNNQEEMEWILENPLENVLPSLLELYLHNYNVSDEGSLRVFKWIKSKGTSKVKTSVLLRAVELGHVQVFSWLLEQGLSITTNVARQAATFSRVEILKIIHAFDSSLVCTEEIANAASRGRTIWEYDVLGWLWETCKIFPSQLGGDHTYLAKWVSANCKD